MFPLGLLGVGEIAEVVVVHAPMSRDLQKDRPPCNRLEDMGLRIGKIIEMLNNEGGGPLLLKIGESRMAIGRRLAMTIMVRKPE